MINNMKIGRRYKFYINNGSSKESIKNVTANLKSIYNHKQNIINNSETKIINTTTIVLSNVDTEDSETIVTIPLSWVIRVEIEDETVINKIRWFCSICN